MTARLQGEIKKGRASLIGGIAVGAAVLVLWLATIHDRGLDTWPVTLLGAGLAVGVAAWIRLADL